MGGHVIMSTNYYFQFKAPKPFQLSEVHIGKISCGWYFSLHVYPDQGISTYEDMIDFLRSHENEIEITDEYGSIYDIKEISKTISEISRSEPIPDVIDVGIFESNKISKYDYLKRECAIEGINNLLHAEVDGIHCVGSHPTLPISYFTNDFS